MTDRPLAVQPSAPLRLLLVALVTLVCATFPAGAAPATPAAPASKGAGVAAYDHHLHEADCTLLGREFMKHRGCSRTECFEGAVPWRTTYGAEACTLRAAPKGYGFGATVDVRQCRALGRRWISEVNYCASEPDRSPGAVFNAPQCVGGATVYVNLEETEGYYDECITTARAAELVQRSAIDGTTLEAEVALRSGIQCPHRPGHVFVNDACVADAGFQPSDGGVLMVGDSLTWRGSDELGRLRPEFTIDGEPARPPTELASRLASYRAGHGQPDGLIIELGTVPAATFERHDLVKAVRSLPRGTRVMLVLPHYELGSDPVVVTPQSRRVGGWMRGLASSRHKTCVADWPAYVRSHPGILQDGVHTRHTSEGRWARWVSQQWSRC
jgi:hypothetical protein